MHLLRRQFRKSQGSYITLFPTTHDISLDSAPELRQRIEHCKAKGLFFVSVCNCNCWLMMMSLIAAWLFWGCKCGLFVCCWYPLRVYDDIVLLLCHNDCHFAVVVVVVAVYLLIILVFRSQLYGYCCIHHCSTYYCTYCCFSCTRCWLVMMLIHIACY